MIEQYRSEFCLWWSMTMHFIWIIVPLLGYQAHCIQHGNHSRKSSAHLIIATAKQGLKDDVDNTGPEFTSRRRHPSKPVVVGFDILLTPAQASMMEQDGNTRRRTKRKALSSIDFHWPKGIIPYTIDPSVDDISILARNILYSAMDHWMSLTCIKFEEYDPHKHDGDRLIFEKGKWCSANLGRIGGIQHLFVHENCLTRGTMIHELGHTIGWFHEHARPDRDKHIIIRWSRVDDSVNDQYSKESSQFVNTYGIPYDYLSIMHYPDNDGELITRDRRAQGLIGQRESLSFYDRKLASIMYNCSAHCTNRNISCKEPGFIDHQCECVCPNGKTCQVKVETSENDKSPTQHTTAPATSGGECVWLYQRGKALSVKPNKVFTVGDLDECKLRCLEELSFKCRSFHYSVRKILWVASRRCSLSADLETDRRFTGRVSTVYFETPQCLLKTRFCGWNRTIGLLIHVTDTESRLTYDLTLLECKLNCLEEQEFQCRSFMYRKIDTHSSICVHSSQTNSTVKSEIDSRIDYYEGKVC